MIHRRRRRTRRGERFKIFSDSPISLSPPFIFSLDETKKKKTEKKQREKEETEKTLPRERESSKWKSLVRFV